MTAGFPVQDPGADLHVHSTFSDDAESTVAENLAAAADQGLHTIGMVDHVRRGTAWLPDMVAAARALDGTRGVRVLVGVEAKMLDTGGALDLRLAVDASARDAGLVALLDRRPAEDDQAAELADRIIGGGAFARGFGELVFEEDFAFGDFGLVL